MLVLREVLRKPFKKLQQPHDSRNESDVTRKIHHGRKNTYLSIIYPNIRIVRAQVILYQLINGAYSRVIRPKITVRHVQHGQKEVGRGRRVKGPICVA